MIFISFIFSWNYWVYWAVVPWRIWTKPPWIRRHCTPAVTSRALTTAWAKMISSFEPRHDKTNKMSVRPAKTQISLGIRPVWSESSPSAWRSIGSLATHWAHSEDSDQSGHPPRLIWIFAGRTVNLLVFSWGGSKFCVWIDNFKNCAVK